MSAHSRDRNVDGNFQSMTTAAAPSAPGSRSPSLRRAAHQLLNSDECATLKAALRAFRETTTAEQLVASLEPVIDSPRKLGLLKDIALLLPQEQRAEFVRLSRARFPAADSLLSPRGDETVDCSSECPAGEGECPLRADWPAVTWDEKITLADSAPVRRFKGDPERSRVIKLSAATFQVRYRARLLSASSGSATGSAGSGSASLSSQESPPLPQRAPEDGYGSGGGGGGGSGGIRLRAASVAFGSRRESSAQGSWGGVGPQEKGFWALNSPRRGLQELRRQERLQVLLGAETAAAAASAAAEEAAASSLATVPWLPRSNGSAAASPVSVTKPGVSFMLSNDSQSQQPRSPRIRGSGVSSSVPGSPQVRQTAGAGGAASFGRGPVSRPRAFSVLPSTGRGGGGLHSPGTPALEAAGGGSGGAVADKEGPSACGKQPQAIVSKLEETQQALKETSSAEELEQGQLGQQGQTDEAGGEIQERRQETAQEAEAEMRHVTFQARMSPQREAEHQTAKEVTMTVARQSSAEETQAGCRDAAASAEAARQGRERRRRELRARAAHVPVVSGDTRGTQTEPLAPVEASACQTEATELPPRRDFGLQVSTVRELRQLLEQPGGLRGAAAGSSHRGVQCDIRPRQLHTGTHPRSGRQKPAETQTSPDEEPHRHQTCRCRHQSADPRHRAAAPVAEDAKWTQPPQPRQMQEMPHSASVPADLVLQWLAGHMMAQAAAAAAASQAPLQAAGDSLKDGCRQQRVTLERTGCDQGRRHQHEHYVQQQQQQQQQQQLFGLTVTRCLPGTAAGSDEAPGCQSDPASSRAVFVSSVATGSLAHQLGIQPGDEILELDGEPVLSMSLQQLGAAISQQEKVVLTVRPGPHRQLR